MNNFAKAVLLGVAFFCFITLLTSCSIAPPSDAKIDYKLDIRIETKEVAATGMIVLPLKKSYTIKLKTPGKMDVLYFKTCSRDFQWERVRSGLNQKKAVIHYTPNEIEREGGCPIKIESFSKKGKHAVGFILFKDNKNTLPAAIICEPKTLVFNGVSKCQGSLDSIKRIKFDQEVLTKFDDKCKIESGRRGNVFEFNIKAGYCPYVFIETKPPYRTHFSVFYGYKTFRPRKQ